MHTTSADCVLRRNFLASSLATNMTVIKWITKSIKKQRSELLPTSDYSEKDATAVGKNVSSSVHNTPAGQWPSEGPQPSKTAVVLFYISIVATVIGTIFTIRTLFYVDFEVRFTKNRVSQFPKVS